MYIIGIVFLPILVNLTTMIQGLMIIFILVGALKFGLSLGTLIGSGGGNAAIAGMIRTVVIRAGIFGMTLLIFIVINIMQLLSFLGPWSQFIFWAAVHFSEAGLAHTILYTKRQQKANKLASVRTASSTSTVAPDDGEEA